MRSTALNGAARSGYGLRGRWKRKRGLEGNPWPNPYYHPHTESGLVRTQTAAAEEVFQRRSTFVAVRISIIALAAAILLLAETFVAGTPGPDASPLSDLVSPAWRAP